FYCLRFLSASISRRTTSIIAMIKIPVWIRSEYVTMAGPSFPNGQEGKEAPLTAQSRTRGAYRLPFIDNTQQKNTIAADQKQGPPSKRMEAFAVCCAPCHFCQNNTPSGSSGRGI